MFCNRGVVPGYLDWRHVLVGGCAGGCVACLLGCLYVGGPLGGLVVDGDGRVGGGGS